MAKGFKSFAEFGAHVQTKKEEGKETELRRRFEKVLKGKFDQFPMGNFRSTLEGIDSVSILRPHPSPKTGKVEALNVVVFYKFGKREGHDTLTLRLDGSLDGQLPERLGLKSQDVLEDILHTAETIDLDFFELVDDDILPAPEREPGGEGGGGGGGKGGPPVPTDPKRLKFMRNQPRVLVGLTGIKKGFSGYIGHVFPDRVILENRKVKNAAYVFALKKPIDVPFGRFKLEPDKRLRKEERKKFLEGEWKDIAGLTKIEARERGAVRIIHPGIEDEEWERKMQAAIDQETDL